MEAECLLYYTQEAQKEGAAFEKKNFDFVYFCSESITKWGFLMVVKEKTRVISEREMGVWAQCPMLHNPVGNKVTS